MDFCWIICELIVWIFYLVAISLMVVTIHTFVNPDFDRDSLIGKIERIISFNFDDDDELYETE